MTPRERKALAEQITANPLFTDILNGMEQSAIEALIYAADDTRQAAQMRVQAIRTFRQDLSASLNTHEPKAAPA
jgi:hypothetical protein